MYRPLAEVPRKEGALSATMLSSRLEPRFEALGGTRPPMASIPSSVHTGACSVRATSVAVECKVVLQECARYEVASTGRHRGMRVAPRRCLAPYNEDRGRPLENVDSRSPAVTPTRLACRGVWQLPRASRLLLLQSKWHHHNTASLLYTTPPLPSTRFWKEVSSLEGERTDSDGHGMRAAQALDEFRSRHTPRHPRSTSIPEEEQQLSTQDGLRHLSPAPVTDVLFGKPPVSLEDPGQHRYLWVIDASGVPYIGEIPIPAIGMKPKHTNLTGGQEAYLGGEMWFASSDALYISGGSGRYPPQDSRQLEEAGEVLELFDYSVTSLGWDDGTGTAKRFLEEP